MGEKVRSSTPAAFAGVFFGLLYVSSTFTQKKGIVFMRSRPSFVLGAVSALAIAASAHASLFSFASDSNNTLPTFQGTASNNGAFLISDSGPSNRFDLLIDDDNGPAPALSFQTRFQADLRAQWIASTPIAGPTVLHTYSVSNGASGFAFRFTDLSGVELLRASLGSTQGVLSIPGTATTWSSAGGIRASDTFANVTWTATQALVDRIVAAGANPATYGIRVGSSVAIDDFAFDLTRLVNPNNGSVVIDRGGLPTTAWTSEGSFSGSATAGIPAPGAAGLLALGGLVATRRRRR